MIGWILSKRGLSTILIVVGVVVLGSTYVQPFISNMWFWFQQHSGVRYTVDSSLQQSSQRDRIKLLEPVSGQFGLIIEKLAVNEAVAAQIDPYDATIYLPILEQFGVAQAKGSVSPGSVGTTYLFGHSTVNVWDIGRYGAPFSLLHKLTIGDRVVTYFQGQRYDYTVTQMKVASPSEVHYLTDVRDKPTLILQTCDPPGSTAKRLLIVAELK